MPSGGQWPAGPPQIARSPNYCLRLHKVLVNLRDPLGAYKLMSYYGSLTVSAPAIEFGCRIRFSH